MTTTITADEGGWQYYQVPRQEFYEELQSLLADFSDMLMEDPQGAQKIDGEIYNDWFFCGYGGNEDSFHVTLWPAYLPIYEAFEEKEISEEEYRAQCWPNTNCQPVAIHLGTADVVIELAEDEQAVKELAHSFAEFAGIELVDDWDEGSDEEDEEDAEDAETDATADAAAPTAEDTAAPALDGGVADV